MSDQENLVPSDLSKADVTRQIAKAIVEKRQLRGLTLEKVSSYLKIRIQYLQAIESGKWEDLPGEVYVRAFIKRYAQYLGMDAGRLLAPYIEHRAAVQDKTRDDGPMFAGADMSRYVWFGVGAAALLTVGLFRLISVDRSEAERSGAAVEEPVVPAVSTAAAAQSSTQSVATADQPDKHTLQVYSPYPLWLRVTAKDRAFEGFIGERSTWTWRGAGSFSIRLGHSRQVRLTFDGREIPVDDNQKKIDIPG